MAQTAKRSSTAASQPSHSKRPQTQSHVSNRIWPEIRSIRHQIHINPPLQSTSEYKSPVNFPVCGSRAPVCAPSHAGPTQAVFQSQNVLNVCRHPSQLLAGTPAFWWRYQTYKTGKGCFLTKKLSPGSKNIEKTKPSNILTKKDHWLHRGRKGPFNYFWLWFLLARVNHLNITRFLRSNKVEIVEF
jgi:hypothetical protein